MNMTITESDKKLLSFLAAFILAMLFIFCVFKPLSDKNSKLKAEINEAKLQEAEMDKSASQAKDMEAEEQTTRERMGQVLQRFYPMLQSQEAENMATILMLNHNLRIENMAITMPERESNLNWYQYSANIQPEDSMTTANEQSEDDMLAETAGGFGIYTARITCTAEGSKEDLMALVDDISGNYPAISILATEWSIVEKQTMVSSQSGTAGQSGMAGQEAGNDGEAQTDEVENTMPVVVPVMRKTGSLTITLEIYMCNQ